MIDLKTGKSVIVRINDRGPYIRGRIIDLTVGAARQLGMYHRGIARVRIEVLREIPILEKPNLRNRPFRRPTQEDACSLVSQGRSVGGSSFREPIKRRQLAAYRVTVRWFMRALIPLLYVLGALSAFSNPLLF